MAIKVFTADLNGGDAITTDTDLIFKIYGSADSYTTAIHTSGSHTSDANVTVTGDVVVIENVDVGTETDFKISAIDEASNESILSNVYNIVTGWTVLGGSYDSILEDVSAQSTQVNGLFFKPDGLKMFITSNAGNDIDEYNLSPAWDITSATHVDGTTLTGSTQTGLFFKPDGLKLYHFDQSNNRLYQYTLSIAWDASTIGAATNIDTGISGLIGLYFNDDGTKVYLTNNVNSTIAEWTLTAYDITTAVVSTTYNAVAEMTGAYGIFFSDDGLKMFVTSEVADATVYEYNLGTAWLISSASYSGNSMSLATQDTNMRGLFIKPDGTKLYGGGLTANASIYQYSMG